MNMNRTWMTIGLLLVASIAIALSPMGGKSPTGTIIPVSVDADGKMETTAVVTVGTATIDVTPSFMEDSTTASSAILTSDGYVPVSVMDVAEVEITNPGSISVDLPDTVYIDLATSTGASLPVNIVNDDTTPILYAGTPSSYRAALATNSVTLLSSVCSFTVPCVLKFNARGVLWTGTAGDASATVQDSELWASGEKQTMNPGSASFNMAMIADPAATCTMSVTVVPLIELDE